MANQELTAEIKKAFDANGEVYGSPRIYHVMRKLGLMCSGSRVARLMRGAGLRARQSRRFRATTKRNKAHRAAPNRLKQDLSANRVDQKWLADITYIPTAEGWLYRSRRIVGWSMSDRMTTDLTLAALSMALGQRRPGADLIHHSDQGSQYTDSRYQEMLGTHGILPSMNSVGTWYDNAPMESFFGTLKRERVHHCAYQTRNEASPDVFYYIEGFYNRNRLHSSLGYLSPVAYESLYHEQRAVA